MKVNTKYSNVARFDYSVSALLYLLSNFRWRVEAEAPQLEIEAAPRQPEDPRRLGDIAARPVQGRLD